MRSFLFILSMTLLSISSTSAPAGEIYACGVPESNNVDVSSETIGYCDFHQRRFAYREAQIKLKKQMQERAKNFAAPRRAALEQYNKDVQALNEIRTSENID